MSIELISILIVVAMLVLMALGLPLAWSIGAVAVALTLYLFEPGVLMMLVARVFDMSLNYTLMAVPLLVTGVLQWFSKRKETRRSLSILGAIMGAFVILLPTALIGVSGNASS